MFLTEIKKETYYHLFSLSLFSFSVFQFLSLFTYSFRTNGNNALLCTAISSIIFLVFYITLKAKAILTYSHFILLCIIYSLSILVFAFIYQKIVMTSDEPFPLFFNIVSGLLTIIACSILYPLFLIKK